MKEIEFDPVDGIAVGSVGEPGERTFMIQARQGPVSATLIIEKEQVVALARQAFQLVQTVGLPEREEVDAIPASDLDDSEEPLWRVGEISIAYEKARDLILLEFQEMTEEGYQPSSARFWVTRPQFLVLGRHGLEVASQGRPTCPWCWEPLEPGHFCVSTNGHSKPEL
ncbi:MAG: DUF3090 family protein [Actinomycetota bacterium]